MPTKAKSSPDAVTLLEHDHDTVRDLLKEMDATTSRSVKKRIELLERIGREIRTHSKLEERIFYPAYHEAAKSHEDAKLFFEATEEHGLVDVVLPALEKEDPASDVFAAKAKVLKDLIEHHAEEEEDEMFPRAKKLLGKERLLELGAEIERQRPGIMEEVSSPRSLARGETIRGKNTAGRRSGSLT